ncbi:MAG TPA: GspMb/PilO family protein [Candidatus Paceibacterota bacterium]
MNSRILPFLALIIAVGIFFGYVKPSWSGHIATTKVAIGNNEQALAAADDYTAKQNALASSRNDIDPENLTRLSTFLPDSVDNVGLILNINALAARSGLSLANIDVVMNSTGNNNAKAQTTAGTLPTVRAGSVGSVDLSLSAVGTYTALQSFLAGIEKSARLLDVRDIVVKGSDTGVYNYQMVIRLYWLR